MFKANWDTEELIENWTLLPQELELVRNARWGKSDWFCFSTQVFPNICLFPQAKLLHP